MTNIKFTNNIRDIMSSVRFPSSMDFNAMSTVKGGTAWVKVFVRMLPAIQLSVTGPRVRAIVVLLKKMYVIGSSQGVKGLVIHLKACYVCLVQALGGHRLKDCGRLNSRVTRNNKGLPRFILAADRLRIRNGDHSVARFYLSLLSIYRVLEFPGKLKLQTISGPFTGSPEYLSVLVPYIPDFLKALGLLSGGSRAIAPLGDPNKVPGGVTWLGFTKVVTPGRPAWLRLMEYISVAKAFWLAKSAPGTKYEGDLRVSAHPFIILQTLATLKSSPVYADWTRLISFFPFAHPLRFFLRLAEPIAIKYFAPFPDFVLGKLGFKEEAAGKVRVFAMVPILFQIVLNPLHLMVQDILRVIPQDGTFDQMKPVRKLDGSKGLFSLDLSAATDRLPLDLQIELLAQLLGSREYAVSWANLLAGIGYLAKSSLYRVNDVMYYSVGQPMGALSSWVMLAFTHHFLVQVAAWKSGQVPRGIWYTNYGVLGDDLVIGSRPVADEYLKIIKLIGMEVGLHKSVLSNDGSCLEFAKRVIWRGVDISPISVTEFFASLSGFGSLLEFMRKYSMSLISVAKMLGFRFRALAKLHTFNLANYKLRMLQVAASFPAKAEDVQGYLELGKVNMPKFTLGTEAFIASFSSKELRGLLRSISERINSYMNDKRLFMQLGNQVESQLERNPHVLAQTWIYKIKGWWAHAANWTYVSRVAGPSEAKEDWCGFEVFSLNAKKPDLLVPASAILPNARPRALLTLNLPSTDLKAILSAVAAHFDLFIMEPRLKYLDMAKEAIALINRAWGVDVEIAALLIRYIEISNEVSLLPGRVVSYDRESTSRSVSPVSIRLWRRWAKFVHGTVPLVRGQIK